METPERIWFLLSRSLSGDATREDTEELMQLLQQQPELMQQYDMLQQLWTVNNPAKEDPEQTDKVSHILQLSAAEESSYTPPQRKTYFAKFRKIHRWAAIFVGCSLLSAYFIWFKNDPHYATSEIVAPKGSKTRTILPDGSTVWLNAGSRITYTDFNGPLREVTLEGEGFFDVTHATSQSTGEKLPFIVHAGNIDIKVLGTAFNVKSYPDDKTIETTLIRGLVQIMRKDGQDKKVAPLYLHPNQKIVLPRNEYDADEIITPEKTTVQNKGTLTGILQLDSTLKENERIETAWVYNRIEFRGESFEQLAPRLERWYNIRIHFEDEAARRLVFNGSLESESVEQAFQALKAAVSFNVTIKNNEIFISSTD
jgi:transmembrane sensor